MIYRKAVKSDVLKFQIPCQRNNYLKSQNNCMYVLISHDFKDLDIYRSIAGTCNQGWVHVRWSYLASGSFRITSGADAFKACTALYEKIRK